MQALSRLPIEFRVGRVTMGATGSASAAPGTAKNTGRASGTRLGVNTRLNRISFLLAGLIVSYAIVDVGATPPEPGEILTPKPPATPRINGAKVFGVRPGHPFLFTIAATGQRPMAFAVDHLPAGLKVDRQSGQITGSLQDPGRYVVTLRAKNVLGQAARQFAIVCGDTIALTPHMGWNDWYCWDSHVTDKIIRNAADAMVSTGLIDHGYMYVNIDDSWQVKPGSDDPLLGGPPRDAQGNINPNKRFPDMKALTDYIHGKGLKAGIYTTPAKLTCCRHEGAYGHQTQDARRFAQWGFDFLKYDPTYRSGAAQMGGILKELDRDVVFNFVASERPGAARYGREVGANSWRTASDLAGSWKSILSDVFGLYGRNELQQFNGPGGWNDPDYLSLGYLSNGKPTRLSPQQQYSYVSLWCLLSAPLILSGDITRLDDFTLNLLTNDEVLEVDQDPLGQSARRVAKTGDLEVWAKDMEDGRKAVGLFNLGKTAVFVTAKWSDLGITGKQIVRDLWRQRDLGTFEGQFATVLRPDAVALVTMKPQPARPREKAVILTPKPPPTPRINGAKVFGVRPGHPFLFTIPATGARPMEYAVDHLPAGLKLDPHSGQITGALKDRGQHVVTFHVKNALGQAERRFKIVCGDGLALTPSMGWNSWYIWTDHVTDKIMRDAADAMVSTGLIDHGYMYVNIDDSWQVKPGSDDPLLGGPPRDAQGNINPNKRFPDMKAMTAYIHNKGLKAGIYTTPAPVSCSKHIGSAKHEAQDARQFAQWGFDFLKYDPAWRPSAAEMGAILQKLDRDIVFNVVPNDMDKAPQYGRQLGLQSWRTEQDLAGRWDAMVQDVFCLYGRNKLQQYSGPGGWNDPDYLSLGYLSGGQSAPARLTSLSPNEQYAYVSLWCLLTAPLILSGDITRLDDFTLSLLSNDEVLEVDQDPLGKAALRVARDGDLEVWAKDMDDGRKIVGLFNLGESESPVTVKWSDLGITGKQIVRDLWRQKDLGTLDCQFAAPIGRHGVVLMSVRRPAAN